MKLIVTAANSFFKYKAIYFLWGFCLGPNNRKAAVGKAALAPSSIVHTVRLLKLI